MKKFAPGAALMLLVALAVVFMPPCAVELYADVIACGGDEECEEEAIEKFHRCILE